MTLIFATPSPSRRQFPGWPGRASLLHAQGSLLCAVGILNGPDDGLLILRGIDGSSTLLDDFFGKGGRRMMLGADDRIVEGQLEMRWAGGRRARWLELNEHQAWIGVP